MSKVAVNPITGDAIQTKVNSDNYRNNYDLIFRRKTEKDISVDCVDKNDESDKQIQKLD